jgi:hypothetical protein
LRRALVSFSRLLDSLSRPLPLVSVCVPGRKPWVPCCLCLCLCLCLVCAADVALPPPHWFLMLNGLGACLGNVSMGAQGDLTTYNIRRLFANVGEGKSSHAHPCPWFMALRVCGCAACQGGYVRGGCNCSERGCNCVYERRRVNWSPGQLVNWSPGHLVT